jgi:hypothetical protein
VERRAPMRSLARSRSRSPDTALRRRVNADAGDRADDP